MRANNHVYDALVAKCKLINIKKSRQFKFKFNLKKNLLYLKFALNIVCHCDSLCLDSVFEEMKLRLLAIPR
jgi:hypothetical protein